MKMAGWPEFAVTYEISAPKEKKPGLGYKRAIVVHGLRKMLRDLGQGEIIFSFRNAYVPMHEYMEGILLETRAPELASLTEEYNRVLKDLAAKGHNNHARKMYVTVPAGAEKVLREDLKGIYGLEAEMAAGACLRSARGNSGEESRHGRDAEVAAGACLRSARGNSGEETGEESRGGVALPEDKRVKTPQAALARDAKGPSPCPSGRFSKELYLYNIPPETTDVLFNDLLGVAAESELRVRLQALDAAFTAEALERGAGDGEERHFFESALPVAVEAVTAGEPLFLASFSIVLYGGSEEEVDRDARLLIASALKYGGMVREGAGAGGGARGSSSMSARRARGIFGAGSGWRSARGFSGMSARRARGNSGGEAAGEAAPRVFTVEQIAEMLPLNVQRAFEAKPMLEGIHPVNESLILADRGNAFIGLIAGTEGAGKTTELKREVIHALLTTEDAVFVVTARPEEWAGMDGAAEKLHIGVAGDESYEKDPDYGLTRPAEVMEEVYRKAAQEMAAMEGRTRLRSARGDSGEKSRGGVALPEDKRVKTPQAALARDAKGPSPCPSGPVACPSGPSPYPSRPVACPSEPASYPSGSTSYPLCSIVEVLDGAELLKTMDFLWNEAIRAKKADRGIQIFIDGVDAFFFSTATSDYLLAIFSGCEVLHVPVTVTVQDAAVICADSDARIEFQCFLKTVTFAKLLNQGPVERRLLQEAFALPDALAAGIIDQGPGRGVLITPATTVAFTTEGM